MTNVWNLDDLLLIIDESRMKRVEIAWIFCLDIDTCMRIEQFFFYILHTWII
jgi:hypothetical protein